MGFLGPEELIPSILLGMGKCFFETDRFAEALATFEKLLTINPLSDSSAEAVFLRGVARYKSTKNPKPLREAYEELNSVYPQSEWAVAQNRTDSSTDPLPLCEARNCCSRPQFFSLRTGVQLPYLVISLHNWPKIC